MVEDWDRTRPGLSPYRPGTRLSCRLWIAPGEGDWALLVGCAGPSGDLERSLRDLPRGVWTTLEVDLGTLPPWHPDRPKDLRLQERDWVRDLRFQCDSGPGLGIFLEDLRIVARITL